MPSSSRRRRRRRRPRRRTKAPSSSSGAHGEGRDWAALPQDILLTVFLKLGPCEIMRGAEFVCTTWRRIAIDEPLLWRRIDLGSASTLSPVERMVACAALDRGAGKCEAFSAFSCDNDFLLYLVERAPSLKSLHLSSFDGSNQVLDVALYNLRLLEDLEITPLFLSSGTENLFESVCQVCPLLRKLRMSFPTDDSWYVDGNQITSEKIKGISTTMCELHSLELLNCDLTAQGLTAILDQCPVLKSLCITGSLDCKLDAELRAKCGKLENLTLPDGSGEQNYSDDHYEWSNDDDELGRESRDYDIWGIPFHPQYHNLHDDLDHLYDDLDLMTYYGFHDG